jgi:phosphatidylinositol phospholipase C, delta
LRNFDWLLFNPPTPSLVTFSGPSIIISTKPPQEYEEFLKAKDKHDTSGNIANLADEGIMSEMESNAEDSDGMVCNIIALERHAHMV